ncbi:MAG: ABC transporter permease [Bacteroidales bacterium]|nr:ABC transporter permease [Bacteroidales bacterium]
MRWYAVFIKGMKEQIRDFWILAMTVIMAPLFIAIYFLMVETETPVYDILLVNQDSGIQLDGKQVNLGDSLIFYGQLLTGASGVSMLQFRTEISREKAIEMLRQKQAEVVVVIPDNLTASVLDTSGVTSTTAQVELVGDVTQMEYIIGAVWTEELINQFVLETAGIHLPISWKETTLGHSGQRSMFELYVPGLLILSIIMIIFSTSAAIVREPETRTLERLKISRLTSMEFLVGISLVQIIIAILSLALALVTAVVLGYTLIPGTLGFILLISFLTSLSMISFSLIVAAMCRSIKEVAIIGTFPLFLLMFFTGAAFPISGGKLFSIGEFEVMLNDILSPKFAVEALNKVLIRDMEIRDTIPEMMALMLLTLLYFPVGTMAFKKRHMRAL